MKKLLVIGAVLCCGYHVMALTVNQIGAQVEVSYQEPNVNADNSPLDDLDHTTILYNINSGSTVTASTVTATSLTGNGNIVQTITIPAAIGQAFNATVWATASDTNGNESLPSNAVTIRVDRLAPAAPR